MKGHDTICGCFPTGRHYPGIADHLQQLMTRVEGLCHEVAAEAPWAAAPLAIIDFETTGLDATKERILEIGVICFDAGAVSTKHNWLVNPGIPVPEQARAVHGISDDDLKHAPSFAQVIAEVSEVLKGRIPVAYNASFDRGFLHAERDRLTSTPSDLPPALRSDVTWIDPLIWARELQKKERSKKLADVAERLGVKLEQAHRASDDAHATGLVLMAFAKDLPTSYGELIRLQSSYSARQDADRASWRNKK